jgi:uncharacterized membrane protein
MKLPKWLLLSLAVPVLWGFWGALTEIPEKWLNPSFPPTLGYVVWSLTMLPVTVIAMRRIGWKMNLTRRSFFYGCAVGFSGAAGQLMLFWVLQLGPAYLIFPIVCLSPAVTVLLSWTILRERTYPLALSGILLSLPAIFLVSLQSPSSSPVKGSLWLFGAVAIFFMWGLQAYFMKSSAGSISSEELFVYMAATGLALSPVALAMGPGFHAGSAAGFGLTFAIQSLNAAGCLLFVYAVRLGKAIVVVPMINGLFPMVTIIVSLLIYREIPSKYNSAGMVLALVAVLFMAFDEVRHSPTESA